MVIQFSNKIKILPWRGENYLKQYPKILVLGMSTYNKDDPKKKCVKIMAEKVRDGCREKWARYWNRITTLLINENKDVYDFWNRISFYNYIQEIMDETKQKTPNKYWEDAKEPFKEILTKLKPDIVIATGYELFRNLPSEFSICKPIKKNNKELLTAHYYLKGKNIYICGTWHPATPGFKYSDWKLLLKIFYKKVEADKFKSRKNGI